MNDIRKAPVMIPVEKLRLFEGHPYKVIDNEEMNRLIESIQEQGILSPLIARPIENTTDEYEVVSGHRRLRAAEKAGMKEVPAFIYALDRDAAAIAVVDSNLYREHILPSEKAFAYKMKMDAMSHQGKRTDLTSDRVGPKLTASEISDSDSATQVKRYIRLTYLIPELLEYMDDGKMALSVGVEISYLNTNFQYAVLDAMAQEDCTP
jgi:ParB family chromosome partitioning protein